MLKGAQKSEESTQTQPYERMIFDRIDVFGLLLTVLHGFTNEMVELWIVQLRMRGHYGKLIILVLITILSIVTTAVIVPLITIAVAGITIFREVVVVSTPTRVFSDGRLNREGE